MEYIFESLTSYLTEEDSERVRSGDIIGEAEVVVRVFQKAIISCTRRSGSWEFQFFKNSFIQCHLNIHILLEYVDYVIIYTS